MFALTDMIIEFLVLPLEEDICILVTFGIIWAMLSGIIICGIGFNNRKKASITLYTGFNFLWILERMDCMLDGDLESVGRHACVLPKDRRGGSSKRHLSHVESLKV